jgi:hypothetical protein
LCILCKEAIRQNLPVNNGYKERRMNSVNVLSAMQILTNSKCFNIENKVKNMSDNIADLEKQKANIDSSLISLRQKIANGQATECEKSRIKYLLKDKVKLERTISDLNCNKRTSEKVLSDTKKDKSILKTYKLLQKPIKPKTSSQTSRQIKNGIGNT